MLDEEWDEPVEELFEDFEHEAVAAASIGQVHRAVLPDGREVAVKIQYPGMAKALAADMSNAGLILRLAKALAPGLDAKAVADELKERVLEELDYEIEAANQRTFARAYRGHPFIVVPDVVTRLSTERVLVSDWVDGLGFDDVKQLPQEEKDRFGEIVFRFCFGSIYHLQHFNADSHPGNYLLMDDGRVAFLDFGMTKRLDTEQIELEIAAVAGRRSTTTPSGLRERARRHRLPQAARADRRREADAPRQGRRRLVPGGPRGHDRRRHGHDGDGGDDRPALGVLRPGRKESLPADELMGQRMQTGVLAVLGQLRATRNWMRIGKRVVVRRRAGDRARPRRVGLLRGQGREARPQVQAAPRRGVDGNPQRTSSTFHAPPSRTSDTFSSAPPGAVMPAVARFPEISTEWTFPAGPFFGDAWTQAVRPPIAFDIPERWSQSVAGVTVPTLSSELMRLVSVVEPCCPRRRGSA